MKSIFIPYSATTDLETGFQVLSALDSQGKVLAVVSEPTLERAAKELADLMLALLEAEASQGRDRFPDFPEQIGSSPTVRLSPTQILPIRLRWARSRANLRQTDMASRLGISQQTYAKLERPGANPTLQTLARLEGVLGQDLLGWA
jgi:DNA-binding XRE family transcriptional regulator